MRDEAAAPLLEGLVEEERFTSWHFVRRDRSVVGRGRGGAELLCAMELTRRAGGLLEILPERALEAAYAVVARHRSRLGRLVPNGSAPRRYP